jgi:hypothetical protein
MIALDLIFRRIYEVDYDKMRVVGDIRPEFVSFDDFLTDLSQQMAHRNRHRRLIAPDKYLFSAWHSKSSDVGFYGRPAKLLFLSNLKSVTFGKWIPHVEVLKPTKNHPRTETVSERLRQISSHFRCLTELNIVRSNVGDFDVTEFAKKGKQPLAVLRLHECPFVGNSAIVGFVAAYKTTLAVLHIHHCHRNLSDVAVKSVEQCAGLREFSVKEQPLVTPEGLKGVKKSCILLRGCF